MPRGNASTGPAGSVKTLEATQLRTVIFVPHVTDIARQEISLRGAAGVGGRLWTEHSIRFAHPPGMDL